MHGGLIDCSVNMLDCSSMQGLNEIITKYDNSVMDYLHKKDYRAVESELNDFCLEILYLTDMQQQFVARTFFVSLVTNTLKMLNSRNNLQADNLHRAYVLIAGVERWENISEFILGIPQFIKILTEEIITHHLLFSSCHHIESAINLISNHLREKYLTVNWLAEQLQISTTHLNNLFKLKIGMTISSYINERKIAQITHELIYTNKTLKEIREKYGFSSHSHFIQYFKKATGITPLKFKEQLI